MGLNIYKASAGSGKTFTLTFEYLKLALSSSTNAGVFRNLLAVTFTNKATEEMKSRIITTLHQLTLDAHSLIAQQLKDALHITASQLTERALQCQWAILHNYSSFSISTIDAFFQKIIHSFVREAGLRPGFKLELDQNRLLEEAISQLLTQLGSNKTLYRWVFKHIEERIESGANWDIKKILEQKGQLVFGETFRSFDPIFRKKIGDHEFMEAYAEIIDKTIADFADEMKRIGRSATDLMSEIGVTVDNFKYGRSGPAAHFSKILKGKYIPSKRCYAVLDDESLWLPKHKNDMAAHDIEINQYQFSIYLQQAVTLYENKYLHYLSAQAIKYNLPLLGLLGEIEAQVREVAATQNLMPISETTFLLSKLINGDETPFIYERMGARYTNYLIDEFQDTSEAQWQNFKPLLLNSLSQRYFCMLVGDVKQSIYRWRNGDWRILAQQVPSDFAEFDVVENNLDTNWRSTPTVIDFNNSLFHLLPSALANRLEGNAENENLLQVAYQDVRQKVSPAKADGPQGYVHISSYLNDDDGWAREKVLIDLTKQIEDLQDRGYQAGDIAILVRRAADGQMVSDALLQHKAKMDASKYCFDLVSSDTLFLNQSAIVRFTIAILRAILDPANEINCAFINYQLHLQSAPQSISQQHEDAPMVGTQAFARSLSPDLLDYLNTLSQQSLPEVFESIAQRFSFTSHHQDWAYIQELHDELLDFARKQLSDINAFLNWWDTTGIKKKLSSVNNPNAIRIITIHQSKGLQFPVVMIPFCNWKLEPLAKTVLWVEAQNAPFNYMSHIPINYSQKLLEGEFSDACIEERQQTLVDNINLLYVACTRAEQELYLGLPMNRKKELTDIDQSTDVANLLHGILKINKEQIEKKVRLGKLQGTTSNMNMLFGMCASKLKVAEDTRPDTSLRLQSYSSNQFQKKLVLRSPSASYLPDDLNQPLLLKSYKELMCRLLALINQTSDLPKAIKTLQQQGWLNQIDAEHLLRQLSVCFDNPTVASWFDGSWRVVNGRSILSPSSPQKSFHKPDRVLLHTDQTLVIAYQFGTQTKASDKWKVSKHVDLLRSMGYPEVGGFVWYVDLNQVLFVR